MFIPDPNFSIPDPRSRIKKIPKSRIRIRIKEFNYFNPKNCFQALLRYDLGCSSRIRILVFYPSRISVSKRHRILDLEHCFFRGNYVPIYCRPIGKMPHLCLDMVDQGAGSPAGCRGRLHCLPFSITCSENVHICVAADEI
jgi:hypothetical protein